MLRVFLKLNPPVILIIESSSLFSIYASGKVKEMTGVSPPTIKSRSFLNKMLRSTSRDMKLHRLQRLAMQWLIHFFSSHVKHLPIFSLSMKELLKDLNDNFKGKRELGMIAGVLSLKYGK